MGLILRTTSTPNAGNTVIVKGSSLTFAEGDGNFAYLLTNMSGSNISISGSSVNITGPTTVAGTFTTTGRTILNDLSGSLHGTASWALNALTASFIANAGSASYFSGSTGIVSNLEVRQFLTITGSTAISGTLNITGSATINNLTGSLFGTSSWSTNAVTASSADSFTVRNTLTAQTITSSIIFVTGSTRFGSLISDNHVFTGSVGITGSLAIVGAISASSFTGSLLGTAATASFVLTAQTASFVTASNVFGPFGSNSIISASYASGSTSASFASTASFILTAQTASFVTSSNVRGPFGANSILSASYASGSTSASFATTASYANNADLLDGLNSTVFATTGSNTFRGNQTITGSLIVSGSTSLTGSVSVLGSVSASSFTGSFLGTSATSSFVTSSNVFGPFGSNSILSASLATTASSASDFFIRADTFEFTGSVIVTGSLNVIGPVVATNFTGSLLGTASYANNADLLDGLNSTVFATTGSNIFRGNQTITGSLIVTGSTSLTGSLSILGSVSASSFTGSLLGTAATASFISTASYANNADLLDGLNSTVFATTGSNTFRGNQIITGSLIVSGSTSLTGSVEILGSISASSFTGSLLGTSTTASFVTSSNVFGPFGSNSILSASFASGSTSASFASTASFVTSSNVRGPFGVNSILSASFASGSTSASFAQTASFVTSSNVFGPFGSNSILSASYASGSTSASFALTASFINVTGSNAFIQRGNSFGTTAILGTNDNQNLEIETNGTTRITINNSGTTSITGSLAQGDRAVASGLNSHAQGQVTTAQGNFSHAEGGNTLASGPYSHAEGTFTTASAQGSHAEGYYTIASMQNSLAIGVANIPDSLNNFSFTIGNGTVEEGPIITRSNLFYAGGTSVQVTGSLGVLGNQFIVGNLNTTGSLRITGSASLTGSLGILGSVSASSFTGSLLGTASTASFVTSSNVFGPFGSNSILSASYASGSTSSSFAATASFITPTGTNAFVQGGNSFGATAVLGTNDAQSLQFEANGTVRMTITGSSGNIGIGTANPGATLSVVGSTNIVGATTTSGSFNNTGTFSLQRITPIGSSQRQIVITSADINAANVSTANNIVCIGPFSGAALTGSGADSLIAIGVTSAGSITTGGRYSIHIGRSAGGGITTGEGNVMISSGDQTGIPSNTTNAMHLIAGFGYESNNAALALGNLTSQYAFIGGGFSSATSINNFYFGAAPFTIYPSLSNLNFYAPSATGSTDQQGANFTLNAGRGTGAGTPGDFIIATSTSSGSSGTQSQSLSNRVWIKGNNGNVGIGTSSPLTTLDVSGSGRFTNSLTVTGSLTVFSGSAVEFQVLNTGVNIGNVSSDVHTVTGSLRITGSVSLTGSLGVLGTVSASSFTGSLLGTASTASFVTSSNVFGPFGSNSILSASYATTASTVNGTTGQLLADDNRFISASEINARYLQFGFTAWNNDNTSPYADYLHMRSYTDGTAGGDNLVMFRKDNIGARIYQAAFGSGTAYSTYKDIALISGSSGAVNTYVPLWMSDNSLTSSIINQVSNNIGISTSPSYKLDINATGSVGVRIFSGSLAVGNITPSATAGRIDASNDIVAFSTSDNRFKTNVTPIPNALDKISQIGGYEFDWIPNQELHGFEGHDIGVIAQEIEKVLPEVVTTRDSGYKAVKYEKIVPLLIEAIKEQQKQIDELKSKLCL